VRDDVELATARHAVCALLVRCVEIELFKGPDRVIMSPLAELVRAGVALSVPQLRQVWRTLDRYRNAPSFPSEPPLPQGRPSVPLPPAPAASSAKPVVELKLRPDGRIGVTAPFAFKDRLKSITGAEWDKRRNQWHFPPSPTSAAALAALFSGVGVVVSPSVAALIEQGGQASLARQVLDPDAPVPDLPWSAWCRVVLGDGTIGSPWEHQRRGVVFCSESPASLLNVRMGGGKTLTAIGALNRAGARTAIIVCPSKVLGIWPAEFRERSPIEWHIVSGLRRMSTGRLRAMSIADRFTQAEQTLFDCRCGKPHVVVVNYEALTYEPFASWRPQVDAIIYDEGHRLRTPSGKASKTAAKWSQGIPRRMALTGTAMPQTPLDVFGLFRALDPGIFGTSWTSFRARYAVMGGYEGRQVVGLRNAEDLAAKFMSITYRPDVELDLPPCVDTTLTVELEPAARKAYDALERDVWADISAAVRAAGGPVTPDGAERTVSPANAAVLLLRLQQLAGGALPDDYGDTAVVSRAKENLLAEALEDAGCGPDEPVVVYCRFRHDLDAVAQVAERLKLRYAEVSGRRSDGLTEDSTMNPDADVVGVQIQSGGTGVNLTRSAVGVWYSMGFSLSDYLQGRARQHRPGQTRPVLNIHLIAADTVDAEVYDALAARADVIAAVLATRGLKPDAFDSNVGVRELEEMGEVRGEAAELPAQILEVLGRGRLSSASVGAPSTGSGRLSGARAARSTVASIEKESLAEVAARFDLSDF
jgi:hypothetical protein